MVRWVCASLVVGAVGLMGTIAMSGCDDGFEAPNEPDLYKVPHVYDLAVEQSDVRDMSAAVDLSAADLTMADSN